MIPHAIDATTKSVMLLPRQPRPEVDIRRPIVQERHTILGDHVDDALPRFQALPADVRRQHDVVERVQGMVRWQRGRRRAALAEDVQGGRRPEAAVRSMVSYSEPASMAALGQCLSAPGTSKCKLQQFLSEARSSRGGSLNIKQVSVELLTES